MPSSPARDVASEVADLLATLRQSPAVARKTDELQRWIQRLRQRERIERQRPDSEFPELLVRVPDSWERIRLAPLYDVHMGHAQHDAERFARHLRWIRETPDVLTWNGGDLIENASKLSIGAAVYEQDLTPQHQVVSAMLRTASIAHKMLFALPGNHEDRTEIMGFSVASWMAMLLQVPYFPDYALCTLLWRGMRFRILAHHGSGAAQTAGAQRMAARKDLAWAKPVDIYWTGHLHSPLVDVVYQTDFDQRTGRPFERTALVVISPSYLRYFGTYAAKKRFTLGPTGLAGVTLRPDGRIDGEIHANGRRL